MLGIFSDSWSSTGGVGQQCWGSLVIAGQVLGGVRTAVLGIFSDSWSSTGGSEDSSVGDL